MTPWEYIYSVPMLYTYVVGLVALLLLAVGIMKHSDITEDGNSIIIMLIIITFWPVTLLFMLLIPRSLTNQARIRRNK